MNEGRYEGEILRNFVNGTMLTISSTLKQMIVGLGVELEGEAKEMAETIVNKEISETKGITVVETTEEGIVLGSKVELSALAETTEMLEITSRSEKVQEIKILGREKIELRGIDEKVVGLTKMSVGIKRSLMNIAVSIGITRLIKKKKAKGVNLDMETTKAIA